LQNPSAGAPRFVQKPVQFDKLESPLFIAGGWQRNKGSWNLAWDIRFDEIEPSWLKIFIVSVITFEPLPQSTLAVLILANPNKNYGSSRVDILNDFNLFALLHVILLIDTDCIDPQHHVPCSTNHMFQERVDGL
jgi:hypothetical protein